MSLATGGGGADCDGAGETRSEGWAIGVGEVGGSDLLEDKGAVAVGVSTLGLRNNRIDFTDLALGLPTRWQAKS
jgi:hypothetical protein